MGSCSDLNNDGGRLGPLLWVRRPNGSWWPGLVLSPDEVVERRKGTPVKLLGREDGSMDWYDLEKSKRIKAFRCGEYDECIEKAKASALCSNKEDRIGKYARRGDAILHALEIERAYYANGSLKFTKEQKHMVIKINKKRKETELSQSVISFENNARSSRLNVGKKNRWRTHSDLEEDVAAGTKRMKGLQDLGISSKREAHTVHHCIDDTTPDASFTQSIPSSRFICLRQVNNSKDLCVPLKRKALSAQLNENLKRKNRHRPLTKLLECTSRLAVPSSCNQQCCFNQPSVQNNRFVAFDSSESRKTEFSDVINDNSDCSDKSCEEDSDAVEETPFDFKSNEYSAVAVDDGDESFYGLVDVPIVVEKNVTIDYSQLVSSCISNSHAAILEKNSKQCSLPVKTSKKKETCMQLSEKLMEGTSNWNSKGKRNSKSPGIRLIKKPTRFFPNDKVFHGDSLLSGVSDDILNHGETWRCRIAPRDPRNVIANQISEASNLKSNSKEHGFGNINLPHEKLTSQNRSEFSVDHQNMKVPDRSTCLNSSLYEVRIDVESNHNKCSSSIAPLISLMSKFSNTAIVGHPVYIEAMDDCSTNSLKAQRTSSKKRSRLRAKKSHLSKRKSSKMKKSMQRKIRKLSSITEHNKEMDTDMEPLMEKSNEGSVIACVPLNLVFSRISEALSCCSSRPSSYIKPPLSSSSSPE